MATNSGGYPEDGDLGNLVTEQVRQGTQQVVQSTQHAVSQVKDQATQQAQSMFERQKGQAQTQLTSISQALRTTGENLREQNQGPVAGVLEGAAGQVDGWSSYIESRNMQQMIGDVENVARRNSTVFLAGAFALGLAAARFLKSSKPGSGQSSGYGGQYGSGANYPDVYAQSGGSTGYGSAYGYGTGIDSPSGYGASRDGYGYAGSGQSSLSGFAGDTSLSESTETMSEVDDVETDRPY